MRQIHRVRVAERARPSPRSRRCSSDGNDKTSLDHEAAGARDGPGRLPRAEVPLPKTGTIDAIGTDSSDGKQFFTITYVVGAKDLSTTLADYTEALPDGRLQDHPDADRHRPASRRHRHRSGTSSWRRQPAARQLRSRCARDGSFTLAGPTAPGLLTREHERPNSPGNLSGREDPTRSSSCSRSPWRCSARSRLQRRRQAARTSDRKVDKNAERARSAAASVGVDVTIPNGFPIQDVPLPTRGPAVVDGQQEPRQERVLQPHVHDRRARRERDRRRVPAGAQGRRLHDQGRPASRRHRRRVHHVHRGRPSLGRARLQRPEQPARPARASRST